MTRVLFSRWPADHAAFVDALRRYITPPARVLMLPLAHARDCDRETYDRKYGLYGRHHSSAITAFAAWGVPGSQITIAHAFDDDRTAILRKLDEADILLLPGGMPDLAVERVDELDLRAAIRAFPGLVMGYSSGALMQMTAYVITPDDDYPTLLHTCGLGLVGTDFHIEVHYEASDATDALLQSIADTDRRPLYAISDNGAILLEDGTAPRLIGDVTVFVPTR